MIVNYRRGCRSCGKWIGYKTKYDRDRAEKNASPCLSCAVSESRRPDLIGQHFGLLTVIRLVLEGSSSTWICRCDCGNEITVKSATNLRTGNTTSCGCSRSKAKPWKRKRAFEALYNRLKTIAGYRGTPVELTYEEFLEFTDIHACTYCGNPVKWNPHCLTKGAATNLDRKNSAGGYSEDNVVVCCIDCNRMKNKWFTHDEFVVVMKALTDYRRSQYHPVPVETDALTPASEAGVLASATLNHAIQNFH
jgi:hypothetical protein